MATPSAPSNIPLGGPQAVPVRPTGPANSGGCIPGIHGAPGPPRVQTSSGVPGVPVPWGWRRALHNREIVYFSPSGAALLSLPHVRSYLLSPRTCKCGLECPFRPEEVFDFDPKVPSIQWPNAPPPSRSSTTCFHKRRLSTTSTEAELTNRDNGAKRRKRSVGEWTSNRIIGSPQHIIMSQQPMLNNQVIANGQTIIHSQPMINNQQLVLQHHHQQQQQQQQQQQHHQQQQQQILNHQPMTQQLVNVNGAVMLGQNVNNVSGQIINTANRIPSVISGSNQQPDISVSNQIIEANANHLQHRFNHQQQQQQQQHQQQQIINQQPGTQQIVNVNGTVMIGPGPNVNNVQGQVFSGSNRIPSVISASNHQQDINGTNQLVDSNTNQIQRFNQETIQNGRSQPPWKQNQNRISQPIVQNNSMPMNTAVVNERVPPIHQHIQYQPAWNEESQRKSKPKKSKKPRLSSECPNVDVRNISNRNAGYQGPSFMDDPTGYLAQQTALLNSTISRQNSAHFIRNSPIHNNGNSDIHQSPVVSSPNVVNVTHMNNSPNVTQQQTHNISLINQSNNINHNNLNTQQNNSHNQEVIHLNSMQQIQNSNNHQININNQLQNIKLQNHIQQINSNMPSSSINVHVVNDKDQFMREQSQVAMNSDMPESINTPQNNCHSCISSLEHAQLTSNNKNIDYMENITVKEDPVTSSTFSATLDGSSVASPDYKGPIQGGTVSTSHKSPPEYSEPSPTSSLTSRGSDTPVSPPSPMTNSQEIVFNNQSNVVQVHKNNYLVPHSINNGLKLMASGNTVARNTITSVLAGKAQTATTSVNNTTSLPTQQYQGSGVPVSYAIQNNFNVSHPSFVQSHNVRMQTNPSRQVAGVRSPLEMVQSVVSNIQMPQHMSNNGNVQMIHNNNVQGNQMVNIPQQMISNNRLLNNVHFVQANNQQVLQNNQHQMLQNNQQILLNNNGQNVMQGNIMQNNHTIGHHNSQGQHQNIVNNSIQNLPSGNQMIQNQQQNQLVQNVQQNNTNPNVIQQKLSHNYNQGHILVSSGGQILMGGNFQNMQGNLMHTASGKSIIVGNNMINNCSSGNVLVGNASNIVGNNVIANNTSNSVLVASNNSSNGNVLLGNNAQGLVGNASNVNQSNNAVMNNSVIYNQNMISNNQNINNLNNQNLNLNNQNLNLNNQNMIAHGITGNNSSGMLINGSNIIQNNQNIVGNNSNNNMPVSPMIGQQTVLVNTIPAPFVLQPGFTTVDGHIVSNVIHPQSIVEDGVRNNGQNFIQRPPILSPESKRKGKKRKSGTVASMLHISPSTQFSPQGFQLSPGLSGLTLVSNKGNSQILVNNQGNQGSFQTPHINLLQPLNLLGPTVQQLIVPQLVMTQDATLLQDSSMPLQLQIQNVNGQNMIGPCQSILTGPSGMLLRAPNPQTKNFISPGGGQFIVNGQVSPLVANVSPGQNVNLYGGSVGLVVPPHSTAQNNTTYVQQNTTIVQQQTTMVNNNNNNSEQNSTIQTTPNSQFLLQSVNNQMVEQNSNNLQNSSNSQYVMQSNINNTENNHQKYNIVQSENNSMEPNTNSSQFLLQTSNAHNNTESNINQNQQNINSQYLLQSVNNSQNQPYMQQSAGSNMFVDGMDQFNSYHSVSTQTAGQTNASSNIQGSTVTLPPPDTTTHSPRSPDRPPSPPGINVNDVHTMAMVHCVSSSEPDSVISPSRDNENSPNADFSERSTIGPSLYAHNMKQPFQTEIKMRHSQGQSMAYGNIISAGGQTNKIRMDAHENKSEKRTPMLQIGDLVWGSARGFPAWPGKIIPKCENLNENKSDSLNISSDVTDQGKDDEMVLVKWFGARKTTELVARSSLKSLSEGLDAHHSAQRAARKSRKLNSQLESAIQEAMAELDRESSPNPNPNPQLKQNSKIQTTKSKITKQHNIIKTNIQKTPIKIAPHPGKATGITTGNNNNIITTIKPGKSDEIQSVVGRLRSSQR